MFDGENNKQKKIILLFLKGKYSSYLHLTSSWNGIST